MAFEYVAYTREGQTVQGNVEAASEGAAETILWQRDLLIVSLKEIQEKMPFQISGGKIKKRRLIVFSRQLATLIESGIPIMRALHLLQEEETDKRLSQVLEDMIQDVEQGRLLSEAILIQGGAFPGLYSRLVQVGEKVGNLEVVLRQLAEYMEREEGIVRKVRGAMAYPVLVLLMSFGLMALMLTVALPPLMGLFEAFDAELPLPTRILIAVTDAVTNYKFLMLGGLVVLIAGLYLATRTDKGRLLFDRIVLKIPLAGRIVVQVALARMCRLIALCLRAGVVLPEIIEMAIRTQGNRVIRSALQEVHTELLQGQGLADPLANYKDIFPGMLVQMVRVGEETGSLESDMDTFATFYEEEADRSIDSLTRALEPALTIMVALIVGFVAVSIVTPMYSLMGSIE